MHTALRNTGISGSNYLEIPLLSVHIEGKLHALGDPCRITGDILIKFTRYLLLETESGGSHALVGELQRPLSVQSELLCENFGHFALAILPKGYTEATLVMAIAELLHWQPVKICPPFTYRCNAYKI